jgi:endonuclease/exonuclease/phosphatase family metal-dependent hydrolase
MRQLVTIFLLLTTLLMNAQDINIVTYNIRLNIASDGDNAWPNRKEMVTSLLRFHEPSVFGLQEALINQINDIKTALPQMKCIGVGRDDGKEAGEYSPIFYDSTKFKLADFGWFWLSETPEKPGLGWDAKYNRICTWVKLKQNDGAHFMVLNTHFDNIGKIARAESAKLILKKLDKLNSRNLPVILMGDFNMTPTEEPIRLIADNLNDSKLISMEAPYGPLGTFNGFDYSSKLTERIDYIFVSGNVIVLKYAVLTDSKDNRYPSDHLPVYVRIRLK